MSPLHPCFYHPQTKRSMISRNVSGLMLRWSDISDLTEPCFVMASPSYPKQFASPPSLPPAAQFVWQPSPLTLLTYFLIGVVTEAAPLRGSSLHPQRNSRKSLCFFLLKDLPSVLFTIILYLLNGRCAPTSYPHTSHSNLCLLFKSSFHNL